MGLHRRKGHKGAFPSMADTIFPQRGSEGQAAYNAELNSYAGYTKSAPAGPDQGSHSGRATSRTRTPGQGRSPFDWGRVAEQYQVPEYARAKGMRRKLSERPKSRSKSRGRSAGGRSASRGRQESGERPEVDEKKDFHWPRELNEKMIDGQNHYRTTYTDEFDRNAPDGANHTFDSKGSHINDIIHQMERSENYIARQRERNAAVYERASNKHQQRAREIEASVRRYFRPSRGGPEAPPDGRESQARLQTGEHPGRLSRMDSELVSSNAGWKTHAQRKFQKQYRGEAIPDFLPKFSQMADMGLTGMRT